MARTFSVGLAFPCWIYDRLYTGRAGAAHGYVYGSIQETLRAGIRPVDDAYHALHGGKPIVQEENGEGLIITWPFGYNASLQIRLSPDTITFMSTCNSWALEMVWAPERSVPLQEITSQGIQYVHEGYDYHLHCAKGRVHCDTAKKRILFVPEQGEICMCMRASR